ncbi:hypothetical protein WJX72_011519 [[Myrmecia] bisecta]|uniref:Histidine--tRNA ligase, cytoplasmic n=1 Tax=[Myrmecia] bisecta TaxID=41462 RepID=A0AAW1QT12_9CHLO
MPHLLKMLPRCHGADVKAFEPDVAETMPYKGAVQAAADVRGLLEGSRQVNPRKGGAGLLDSIVRVPQVHGALDAAVKAAYASVKAELTTVALPADKIRQQPLAPELLDVVLTLARRLLSLAKDSLNRIAKFAESTQALAQPVQAAYQSAQRQSVELGAKAAGDALPTFAAALLASQALAVAQQALAVEALAAVLSLRAQEGPAQPVPEADGGSLTLNGENGKAGQNGGGSVDHALQGVQACLDPARPALAAHLDELQKLLEANQVHRAPKVAKGTRDFLPDQMMIRKRAMDTITQVFSVHGAVAIDTPVFELRETLMGKYGEDSKLIYDLADQGGEILSLRYDLTVPFARYVALHGVSQIKRYHIAKVYRRDQPQMTRGRFREFYQCDFDIAGSYPTMVADAEVLKVTTEILTNLRIGQFKIKLNHRGLLDSYMALAGVPAAKFRAICSAIDKLDKEPWEAVRAEMTGQKGLAPEAADKIHEFVQLQSSDPEALVRRLLQPGQALAAHPPARAALEELAALFSFLRSMGALGAISFDLSLARGLDYYTGVIYEAVLEGAAVGSIAAGGRYDNLVGMFSGRSVPAVGISIGIERIFAIMEAQERQRALDAGFKLKESDTQVIIVSIGKGMQQKRMEVCAELWAAGIPAEFGYKANSQLKDMLGYADTYGIPFVVLFGDSELAAGTVKIKEMAKKEEVDVQRADLVRELKQRIAALQQQT